MIAQKWKDRWYSIWTPVLLGNLYKHKLLVSRIDREIKANIGCGKSQFPGWINIDGNFLHRPDMWLDVRYGLPFRSASVKLIYSCHFFEHFHLDELKPLLAECCRVLQPDGGLRIAVPNLRSAIESYCRGSAEWFSTFPNHFDTLGGRFFNEMLCGDQHRVMFDFDFLSELLTGAGFQKTYEMRRGESQLLASGDDVLAHELAGGGKVPDSWLLVEAIP